MRPFFRDKIPATLVMGFLGSGKTSLIRHQIAQSKNAKFGILINEMGEMGIDHEILKEETRHAALKCDLIEVSDACISRDIVRHFLPVMRKFLAWRKNPSNVVIEAPGQALPKPLVQAFTWPDVRNAMLVDSVVAVFDAAAVADGVYVPDELQDSSNEPAEVTDESPRFERFRELVSSADIIVVNKTDTVSQDELVQVDEIMRRYMQPGVRIIHTQRGEVDPMIAMGVGTNAEHESVVEAFRRKEEEPDDGAGFESFIVEVEAVPNPEVLASRLRELAIQEPVYRVKGFIAIQGKFLKCLVQSVGQRVDSYYGQQWLDHEGRIGRLVVVGERGLSKEGVRAIINPKR